MELRLVNSIITATSTQAPTPGKHIDKYYEIKTVKVIKPPSTVALTMETVTIHESSILAQHTEPKTARLN